MSRVEEVWLRLRATKLSFGRRLIRIAGIFEKHGTVVGVHAGFVGGEGGRVRFQVIGLDKGGLLPCLPRTA